MLPCSRLTDSERSAATRQHAVLRDVVQPLDDFRDAAARAGDFAGLAEQRDLHLFLSARRRVLYRQRLRLFGQIRDAQTLVEERIAL